MRGRGFGGGPLSLMGGSGRGRVGKGGGGGGMGRSGGRIGYPLAAGAQVRAVTQSEALSVVRATESGLGSRRPEAWESPLSVVGERAQTGPELGLMAQQPLGPTRRLLG